VCDLALGASLNGSPLASRLEVIPGYMEQAVKNGDIEKPSGMFLGLIMTSH
jgi:hypothetical protein